MMKIAVNPKMFDNIGYQIILNEEFKAIGVNILFDKKIMNKERFKNPILISSQKEEYALAQRMIESFFKK